MIDHSFRQILPRFSQPLLKLYAALRVTPNQVTLIALALAVVAAGLTAVGASIFALVAWWISRLLDGTDGIYARATNQVSDFGGYLDIVCDMAAYSVVILGFMQAHPAHQSAWTVVLFLYVLCITSALSLGTLEEKRQLGIGQNRSLRLGAGLAEGGETGIAYTVFWLWPQSLAWTLPLWILILLVTILARSLLARQILKA